MSSHLTSESGELYASVPRLAAGDSVALRIERLIVDQRLKSGDLLPPERELAARLAVSRNILREALRSLSARGLLQVVPGRGTFVAEPTAGTVQASLSLLLKRKQVRLSELCDVRDLIEPEMAARAAEHATPDDYIELARWISLLDNTRSDPEAHVDADLGFHQCIATAAAHPVLEAIGEAVSPPVLRSMLVGTTVPSAIENSDNQHRRIFAAITSRDPEASRKAMLEHLGYIRSYVRQLEAAEERPSDLESGPS